MTDSEQDFVVLSLSVYDATQLSITLSGVQFDGKYEFLNMFVQMDFLMPPIIKGLERVMMRE